jgi:hypothetical protein
LLYRAEKEREHKREFERKWRDLLKERDFCFFLFLAFPFLLEPLTERYEKKERTYFSALPKDQAREREEKRVECFLFLLIFLFFFSVSF